MEATPGGTTAVVAATPVGRNRLTVLCCLGVFVGWIAGPFLAAGTLRWGAGWSSLGAMAIGLILHRAHVARHNPELLQRRSRIGSGTKTWDVLWNLLFWPLMIAIPVVGGLGVRFGWPAMPAALWPVGALLLAAGLALSGWAMASNPYFEGTIRIQADVGHRVVQTGPYRFVRHPGYAGLSLWGLASPFLVLSYPALVPSGLVVAWLILRTTLEDAFLQRELPGYAEYSSHTRSRLIPGVW